MKKEFIEKVFKVHGHEIGAAKNIIYTCKLYDTIQENLTQLVFVHYKQVDSRTQKVLAKHHCPNLVLDKQLHKNVAIEEKMDAFLKYWNIVERRLR